MFILQNSIRCLKEGDDSLMIERLKKRVEVGDEHAFSLMGCCYRRGAFGVPQDSVKPMEWLRNSTSN